MDDWMASSPTQKAISTSVMADRRTRKKGEKRPGGRGLVFRWVVLLGSVPVGVAGKAPPVTLRGYGCSPQQVICTRNILTYRRTGAWVLNPCPPVLTAPQRAVRTGGFFFVRSSRPPWLNFGLLAGREGLL